MPRRRRGEVLDRIFAGLQRQMEAQLSLVREAVDHPGAKGTAAELEWTKLFARYLPQRYCATKGFVVDSTGRTSDELDVIIVDRQYSPFILEMNGAHYVPAESVYAVIEVKQTLSAGNIAYAKNKAESVRRLKRTTIPIPHAGGVFDPKVPARMLAGIVALDGTLSGAQAALLREDPEQRVLNFGCSLLSGAVFRLQAYEPWKANPPPYDLAVERDSNALVSFLLVLTAELQRVGTVVAMDVLAYRRRREKPAP